MGLFKKKPDPIGERARDLNKQISELEKHIRRLSEMEVKAPPPEPKPSPPDGAAPAPNTHAAAKSPALQAVAPDLAKAKPHQSGPRIRSTSLPLGATVPVKSIVEPSPTLHTSAPAPRPGHEPIFEEVGQNPFRDASSPAQAPESKLGIRQDSLSSSWQRLKHHFRGPPTANPKLVNYLAAGSIQGLRPLRYERRVARNRFIVLVAFLLLFLLGVLALILKQ